MMPAINVPVCPFLADADLGGVARYTMLPMSILLLPVVRFEPALKPKAMLATGVQERFKTVGCVVAATLLAKSALSPLAVLPLPVVLLNSA